MSNLLDDRIESVEIKVMHQESAVEELTQTLLSLEKLLRHQDESIKRLEIQLRALSPAQIASADEETPPPHY
ncbi:MAG: SlyX family protein [Gammaproteobacteria bacterium]